MPTRAAAIANDPIAEEAAQDFLLLGGSALGAALAGYFAAAGAFAGVLLGPVSLIVGGLGVGTRCFDGRLRQPGLGTKRPRGFRANEAVPDAARIAVPTGVAAALVAHAYDGSQKLGSIMRTGIARAERSGAAERAALLKRIRSAGAGAFSEPSFVRAMLHVGGPSEGGLLTPSDFGAIPDIDAPAVERKFGSSKLLEPPWAAEGAKDVDPAELGIGCAVCAVDVRGVFAALNYYRVSDGMVLEELDVEAPLAAVPVRRGVARVAPGARIPAPAPIGIRQQKDVALEVLAAPSAARLEAAAKPLLSVRRNAKTQDVEVARA
jgi:hypothetical protein